MYETNANFPEILERSKITPIAKVKKPKDLTDFRTISIQTTLSKILEPAMLNQIDTKKHCTVHNMDFDVVFLPPTFFEMQ